MLNEFIKKYNYKCWCQENASRVVCYQLYLGKPFVVLQCECCKTHRIIPHAAKNIDKIKNLYNTKKTSNCISDVPQEQHNDIAKTTIERLKRIGVEIDKNKKVLDVGCSDGFKINIIKSKYSCNVFGLDLNEQAIKIAKKKYPDIDFRTGFIENQEYKKNSFDIIIASAIIEHVIDPVSFLKQLKDNLKPDGQIYILTPNSNSLLYFILGSLWRELLAIGEHVYLFDRLSISKCADEAGLIVTNSFTDFDKTYLFFDIADLKATFISLFIKVIKKFTKLISGKNNGDILHIKLIVK